MTYISKYIVKSSPTFNNELEKIYNYLSINLNEINIANKFYIQVKKQINSLQQFPERNVKIYNNKNKNLRRMIIGKFVIIYEVNKNARSSFYFTYFPF